MSPPTIYDVLSDYLLSHDLRGDSPGFYRRTVGVLCSWYGAAVPAEDFTAMLVNRLLLAKQEAGRSSHYRRSLRSGLRALLRHAHGDCPRLRPVKCSELPSDTWTAEEVYRLADAAGKNRLLVLVAYFTGLSECDLRRLRREDVRIDGSIPFERKKTGKRVLVAVPLDLLAELPAAGPLFPLTTSGEYFRRCFRATVQKAGLCGTFKKLRRSSGTAVEILNPGRGHIHLGNTRAIFEAHYLDKSRENKPMLPPMFRPDG
jgi:integrase